MTGVAVLPWHCARRQHGGPRSQKEGSGMQRGAHNAGSPECGYTPQGDSTLKRLISSGVLF